jgi:iron-sulfur cluster repair protein YtfE (RIC family)
MSDIYTVIKQEHDNHRRVLAQLAETQGDSAERRELYQTMKQEVEAHTAAEEQTFYARLMAEPDGQERARHSVSEHKEADDIIEEMDEMAFSSTGWLTKFRSLKKALEHHMDEEENEVFRLAKKLITADEAAELGVEFEERKSEELATA